jgi:type IV secretion system protein VirB2
MKTLTSYLNNMNVVQLLIATLCVTFLFVEPSFAQNFDSINTVLSKLLAAITGPIGRTIAGIAICAVGFAFLTGRMDWQFAIAIVVGIAIIFGAASFGNTFNVSP